MTQTPQTAPVPDCSLTPRAGGGFLRRTSWALAIAALIFLASSRPYVVSPGLTEIDDKFAHFAVYGLLGTLVCRMGHGGRAAAWSLLAASAFGASDEWHQSFVPGRVTDLGDWMADTFGAAVAVIAYVRWTWYRRLLETPVFRRRLRVEKT